jgi:hypothetical protein
MKNRKQRSIAVSRENAQKNCPIHACKSGLIAGKAQLD